MGEPLSVDGIGGHFWGTQGEQANSVATVLLRAASLIETGVAYITALQGTPHWETARPVLEERLAKGRHDLTLEMLPKMIQGAGIPVEGDFQMRLLSASVGPIVN